jgi:uncharacterized protein
LGNGRWQGRVVLVTGGSKGLGRAIAVAFAEHGAKVAIAARNAAPLESAADALRQQSAEVLTVPTDVTSQADVDAMIAKVIERFGRLDVLVNNAGRSARGAAADTTAEDFAELLNLNVIALVRCTRAALPHLLGARGSLVNIGSLAGKSAARYMGAYAATKHAVSAYSQQLRLELGPQGLHVLLVSPGPIARDEPRSESYATGVPAAARKPGAGVKVGLLRPEKLAEQIVRACERRAPELVVPRRARLVFAISQLWPTLGDWIVRRMT